MRGYLHQSWRLENQGEPGWDEALSSWGKGHKDSGASRTLTAPGCGCYGDTAD